MVNGNYVVYGDRPSSESEIVEDHVHSRTIDRKNKRKTNRTANELQHSLNMAQLDNETDSVKYEKKIKEPRLLRYVPTTDVEEHYVTEKFETYDLKPTEEQRPRRYAFTKKPKNPTDGSVNYAYSRSSSSSPTGNLPTISEHGEQYGTYKVRSIQNSLANDTATVYESKYDKYFAKPREVKKFAAKGSHPDSLYRVPTSGGAGAGRVARVLRIMRWPVALIAVCVALAVFVYFLMPDSLISELDSVNGTFWETSVAKAQKKPDKSTYKPTESHFNKVKESIQTQKYGPKTSEIDFYEAENNKNIDVSSIIDTITDTNTKRVLPIAPVFPTHITPEVQYGNEKADAEVSRTPKLLEDTKDDSDESTLKPHITQKPEKPLAVYFKDATTSTSTENIVRAETYNDFTFGEKLTANNFEEQSSKIYRPSHKDSSFSTYKISNIKDDISSETPTEAEEPKNYGSMNVDVNFTSGHSKIFGISIEDAEKMKATTQSSTYNTRVSPTLPTWRDGDDTTTKKYPVNFNVDVPQCRSPRLALCRGVIPYDLASASISLSGIDAATLVPQFEYLVATNCSSRVRHFACALLEPECNPPPYPAKLPCQNLCKAIVDSCEGQIPRELSPMFQCNQYLQNNCMSARTPCYPRESPCDDGTCIPRDWICDGSLDCPGGEDESICHTCDNNEYRCRSGTCILKRWLCDGYSDCPGGEDEADNFCESRGQISGRNRESASENPVELGEEPAGSAPAPAIRRPNKGPLRQKAVDATGENESSKELLITSDSTNSYKRNFTRRPSPSRLTPYKRPIVHDMNSNQKPVQEDANKVAAKRISNDESQRKPKQEIMKETKADESNEDVAIGDMNFFEEFEKAKTDKKPPNHKLSQSVRGVAPPAPEIFPDAVPTATVAATRLDKSINKLERVINGAALLREAAAAQNDNNSSPETNSKTTDKIDYYPHGSSSSHASPCPSSELRCVDGRCITLAQLCDGTIDCSDHADEDNCYT